MYIYIYIYVCVCVCVAIVKACVRVCFLIIVVLADCGKGVERKKLGN